MMRMTRRAVVVGPGQRRAGAWVVWLAVAVVWGQGPAQAAPLSVALIPPQDYAPTLSQFRAAGNALGIAVDEVSPEELVDPEAFSPSRYPLAVYAGGERYAYTVRETGDGAEALLRYVREGGVLLISGLCWPFYRPVDWSAGRWAPSEGQPPRFTDDVDRYLLRQMRALNQTSVGNFNRFLGLNISGEGTVQFEAPEESITFRLVEGAEELFSLPATFPFPEAGDQRYRPVSPRVGLPGYDFRPIAVAVGASGREYGPGIAVVRPGEEGAGVVVYVWGTLMDTGLGETITRDVLRLAAQATSTPEDTRRMADLAGQARELEQRAEQVAARLAATPPDMPARGYLVREGERVEEALTSLDDTIMVRNFEAAAALMDILRADLARLESRLAALLEG